MQTIRAVVRSFYDARRNPLMWLSVLALLIEWALFIQGHIVLALLVAALGLATIWIDSSRPRGGVK